MTEHKFTDEEIIRAMECCFDSSELCEKCPYEELVDCTRQRDRDALDLINRQKAEINSLEDTLCGKLSASAAVAIADLKEKGEEMEQELKSEAVKEFAENIKAYYSNIDKTVGALINYTIDQKLKEFLGEGGENENG